MVLLNFWQIATPSSEQFKKTFGLFVLLWTVARSVPIFSLSVPELLSMTLWLPIYESALLNFSVIVIKVSFDNIINKSLF